MSADKAVLLSATVASPTSAGMLFAHLQLRAPTARSFLLAAPRSRTQVPEIARDLAAVATDAGCHVRLVDLRAEAGSPPGAVTEQTDPRVEIVSPAAPQLINLEAAREALTAFSGITFAYGGGLLDSPSTLIAAAVVDGVIIVARQGRTARADLEQARAEVERSGGRLLGAVLTN